MECYEEVNKFISSIQNIGTSEYEPNVPVFVTICSTPKRDNFRRPMLLKKHCLLAFDEKIDGYASDFATDKTGEANVMYFNQIDLNLDKFEQLRELVAFCKGKTGTDYNCAEILHYINEDGKIGGITSHSDGLQVDPSSCITTIAFGDCNNSPIFFEGDDTNYKIHVPLGHCYSFVPDSKNSSSSKINIQTLKHGRFQSTAPKSSNGIFVIVLRKLLPYTVTKSHKIRFFEEALLFSKFSIISFNTIFPKVPGASTYPKKNSLQWIILNRLNPQFSDFHENCDVDCWPVNKIFPSNNSLLALLGLHTKIVYGKCFDYNNEGVTAIRSKEIICKNNTEFTVKLELNKKTTKPVPSLVNALKKNKRNKLEIRLLEIIKGPRKEVQFKGLFCVKQILDDSVVLSLNQEANEKGEDKYVEENEEVGAEEEEESEETYEVVESEEEEDGGWV